MTISSLTKKAALSLALATGAITSAHASQHDITVWASVDPTLDLRKADGTALWDTAQLTYSPASGSVGLSTWTEQVRIFSNDEAKDVLVRVAAAPTLKRDAGGGTDQPLTVSLNGTDLALTNTTFSRTTLFPSGTTGESIRMPLSIRPTTKRAITDAGRYSGTVSIVMVQTDPP